MDFWSRMKETLDKGIATSRDLYDKARDKAQDLTDRGVLRFEISQLESRAEKLLGKLGSRAFEALVTEGQTSLSRKTAGVKELIDEIDTLQNEIKSKEEQLAGMQQEPPKKAPSGA